MINSNILNQSLEQREAQIEKALAYITQTQKLFEKYASSELKAKHSQFEELIKSLQSDKVRLVVIGEFSRGKSRLVNALLDISLLPSAKEATTAINTFLQSPPAGRENDRYIQLNFLDSRPSEELPWDNDDVLKQWGTELDKNHQNQRSQLLSIDVFTPHPLLDKGLVVIDTPGLESVVAHHEDITRKAIANSHIAIWVQSVEQLGGNSREWAFLKETVRQHFRKFITVINMWDQVLEPEDDHDKAKPEQQRTEEKLNTVRDNFKKYLTDVPASDLANITNDQHLMGVSAKWALSANSEERSRSGIDKLTQRIAELCHSGEAQEEIFYKPLKQLESIQTYFAAALEDEINALSDTRDLKEQQNELELLEQEIKNQTLEQRQTENEFRDEHFRAAQVVSKQINENLVQPLRALRDEVEIYLTESYIKREIEIGHENIGLPANIQDKFKQVNTTISNEWIRQQQEVESRLNDLKADYVEAMKKHAVKLQENLGDININIPEINIELPLDLSGVIEYQNKKLELELQLEQSEEKIHQLELETASLSADHVSLQNAQAAYERARRNLADLGSQPAPRSYSKREKVSDGGMYSSDKYETVTRYDDSNVTEYKKQHDEIKTEIQTREQHIDALMQAEAEKSLQRQTVEVLRRKAEQQFAKLEKQRKEQEQRLDAEKQQLITETLRNLKNNTVGELNQRIYYLETNASKIIEQLFESQLDELLRCVEEQFMQPLRAKQNKREEVLQVFEQGKTEIERRKAEIIQVSKDLSDVIELTANALNH